MRTHGIAMIMLLAIGLTVGTGVADPPPRTADQRAETSEAEKLFQKGRDALLTGQYDEAVKLLAKAVAADETQTSYRLHLARAYCYAGKSGPAETHLKAILKITPEHVEAGQLLAEIHARQKNWKGVVEVLEPLLKYRHDYTTYHMLAEATYNLDQHDKARKHFEEAIKLNPQSASDHYQLGNLYLAGKFYALAAEAYQSAIRLGTDSPVLRYKLASALFNLRNYFGKIAVVTVKAGKVGEISKGWYLIEPVPGRTDTFRAAPANSAIYQIAKAVADGIEDRPDIHFLMASIYLNARRHRQAYGMFEKIQAKIPKEDKALFYYYYAQAAFGIGKYDRYLKLLAEAINLDKAAYEPTLVEAYVKVAEQHNQLGELDKYIHYLQLAVAASPQTASLHLKLGYAYEEARKYDLAVVQWRMVLELEPDHADRMKLINLIGKHEVSAPAKPKTD